MTDEAWSATMEEESMDLDSVDRSAMTPFPVRPPEREEEEGEAGRFRPRTPDSSDAPGRDATAADATATPDPPDPRPRQPRRAPRHPRPHDKPFYTRHRNVVAVLSVTSTGFTLCNGVESLSNDAVPVSGATLARCVHEMSVKKLYVTDHYTRRKWNEVQRRHPDLFPFLDLVPMCPPARARESCCYCGRHLCHRWWAVKLGYNRIARCSIDPIRH